MADETTPKPAQKLVKMPRAVHELRTGKADTDVIAPGTLITDQVAKSHKLTDQVLEQLVGTGAVDLAEVLTV